MYFRLKEFGALSQPAIGPRVFVEIVEPGVLVVNGVDGVDGVEAVVPVETVVSVVVCGQGGYKLKPQNLQFCPWLPALQPNDIVLEHSGS